MDMENLMKARLFSWLEDMQEEMMREEIGLMVRKFMDDLERWLDEGRDYKVVARRVERVRACLVLELVQDGDRRVGAGAFPGEGVVNPGGKLIEYEEIIKLLELILGIELPNYWE